MDSTPKAPKETTLVHVADLNPTHCNHHLRLRVVHAWLSKQFYNPSQNKAFEMVLVDELGDTIEGYVKKEWIELFRNILTDGLAIMLSNIQVGTSVETFRYSPHRFKINFHPDTKVKVIENFAGPIHQFNFTPFNDVIENRLQNNAIVDIIGLVVHVGGIITGSSNNKSNKRRILRLEDSDGLQIDCTIWDVYVDEFNRFLDANSEDNHVILIIQFGKIKGFNSNIISFGTALNATKLYINEDIPAINDFKERLKGKVGNDSAKLKMASISTQTVLSSPTTFFEKCVPTTFPHTEVQEDGTSKTIKSRVSMREYFAYKIQERDHGFSLILNFRKLFQQFLVDAYTMIEAERLSYIRHQQKKLRCAPLSNVQQALNSGTTDSSSVGKRIILPSSFTGSQRYMVQNYLDAMALVKAFGYPDLFLTFTCSPKWPEIRRHLQTVGLKAEDKATTISRMFKIKLDQGHQKGKHFWSNSGNCIHC